MQVPLEDALKELPISDEIRRGLIQQEGAPGQLLRLILAYEKADWAEVKKEAEVLGLDVNEISEQYVKCSDQVDSDLGGAEPGSELRKVKCIPFAAPPSFGMAALLRFPWGMSAEKAGGQKESPHPERRGGEGRLFFCVVPGFSNRGIRD